MMLEGAWLGYTLTFFISFGLGVGLEKWWPHKPVAPPPPAPSGWLGFTDEHWKKVFSQDSSSITAEELCRHVSCLLSMPDESCHINDVLHAHIALFNACHPQSWQLKATDSSPPTHWPARMLHQVLMGIYDIWDTHDGDVDVQWSNAPQPETLEIVLPCVPQKDVWKKLRHIIDEACHPFPHMMWTLAWHQKTCIIKVWPQSSSSSRPYDWLRKHAVDGGKGS